MIRLARENDAGEIEKLLREFMVDYNRQKVLRGIQYEYSRYADIESYIKKCAGKMCNSDESMGIVYVFEKGERLAGYICGRIKTDEDKKVTHTGVIDDWFVTEKHRDSGIGNLLFEKIVDDFKMLGAEYIQLEVFNQNELAIEIYKNMGFEQLFTTVIKRI